MTIRHAWRRLLALGLMASAVVSAVAWAPDRHWWAFSAPWDPRSAASVRAHGREFGAVVTGWVALDTLTLLPTPLYHDTVGPTLQRFALVTNYFRDRFRPETVRKLAGEESLLSHTTDSLASLIVSRGYRGVVIDFEGMAPADTTALTTVVHAIAGHLHARAVSPVAMTVVAADTTTYPARALIAAGADRLIVMVYDEHWSTSAPGPIASPRWARQIIAARVAEARGPAHLVVAVPTYGYQWRRGASSVVVGADDAHRLASTWHTTLARDPVSLNLTATGPDSATLWVADGLTADTLVAIAGRLGINTFALWRLGLADSAFWVRR
jgi:peptidoglycan-N-acetylglucosamine deacetylase